MPITFLTPTMMTTIPKTKIIMMAETAKKAKTAEKAETAKIAETAMIMTTTTTTTIRNRSFIKHSFIIHFIADLLTILMWSRNLNA